MTDTTPPSTIPAGWKPTTSTVAGAVLGGSVGQLVISAGEFWVLHGGALKTSTAGAIVTVCIALAGYFFPDGGRK